MTLVLSILRCPEGVAPETRIVTGGEFAVGRGTGNDWVLPDPDRMLSKQHCRIVREAGGWQILDTSSNGTFLNHEIERLGPETARMLREGDRLILGAYEIEVSFADDAPLSGAAPLQPDLLVPPRPLSPGSPPRAPSRGTLRSWHGDSGPLHGVDPASSQFGDDDLLSGQADTNAPTSPDHASILQTSFRPPPSALHLPEDWDREEHPQASPAGASDQASMRQSMPGPGEAPATAAGIDQPLSARPVAELREAVGALYVGAAIDRPFAGDPQALLHSVGGAFRAVVVGLRRIMIARAAIKGEFRIEQTTIRVRGNNPLKFSADDDDALGALLGTGRTSDMTAEEAVADALRDMRLHELAMASAMQQAVREMLDRLAPERVTRALPPSPLDALPGIRRLRSWAAYADLHATMSAAFTDDFDSVFGKAFARAYEGVMAELGQALDR